MGFVRTPELSFLGRWDTAEPYEEIYDAVRDPLELTNVWTQNQTAADDFRSKMKAYIDAGWATTKGSFLQADPQ